MIGLLEKPLTTTRPSAIGFGTNRTPEKVLIAAAFGTSAKRRSEEEDNGNRKVRKLEPTVGMRPIVTMTLHLHHHNTYIQVLLDPGASVPVISQALVRKLHIPTVTRKKPRALQTFDAQTNPLSGKEFSTDLILQHNQHFSKVSCEISPLEKECDIILPHWWLQQHPPSLFFTQDPSEMQFNDEQCRLECTQEKVMQNRPVIAGTRESLQEAHSRVPEKYQEYIPIMSKEAADRLPDHKPWDHTIDLMEGKTPSWGPLYSMSEKELRFLKPWIENLLTAGKIRPSKAPCAAPLFMVNKLPSLEHEGKRDDEDLRPVIDYRGLNKITIPNKYPLPLASELQDRLANAKYFTKIDLKTGFHLIRIK